MRAVQKGRDGQALPATTVEFESGRATLACAETEQRPTVLGLIASGRMKPDAGEVLLDRKADRRGIRRRIALVDAPSVCDPAPDVTVAGVAAEELMFAGIPANPISVAHWLADLGLGHLSRVPIGNVDPEERLRLLTELAVLRDDVEGLVIVAPDRHGGDPIVWWSLAKRLADRGYAVLVVAGDASAAAIGAADMLGRLGADEAAVAGDGVDAETGDDDETPENEDDADAPAQGRTEGALA
ncbi:hypothetical protein ET445_05170 [Agromyces protaetiae]|uniref:ABC transporter ATP-binding protein n=1 Tax=Agromyces protaetiae TaxID=2509455 RepID=A0A4P6FFX0_9MICO|nr:hypothetical protein ET445_05170 [Agromyces protaetiae]